MNTDSEEALVLDFRSSEVNQQPYFDARGFQHVEQLRFVAAIVLRIHFQFDENATISNDLFSDLAVQQLSG